MNTVNQQIIPVFETWEWQFDAACRDIGDEPFFHPSGERGKSRRDRIANAKRICHQCPVIEQCKNHALTTNEPYGIWGGLSEDERREIKLHNNN